MSSDGDWIEVRRRRRYPDNWRCGSPPKPITPVYVPFQPTYAQVLTRNLQPSSPTISAHTSNKTSSNSSSPTSPTNSNKTTYYVSPHSPSRLRFPPSPSFAEWKGRCFKCTRTGHVAAICRNPKKCGRCWSDGHIGSHCTQTIVPPPLPDKYIPQPQKRFTGEPSFDELLVGSYPYRSPEMPSDRPICLHTFLERDDQYYAELNRLKQAVVMHTRNFQWDLGPDNAGDYAVRTGLVAREEIQVCEISGSRFLIILPKEVDPDTFINATPQSAWDEGITFQPWSPLDDAAISIPAYKVLVTLTGIPPHLWREDRVMKALSRFGLYLGSVAPEDPAKITSWTAAVAVDDLSLVPHQLAMHIGGMVHTVMVNTLAWKRTPLYPASELPKEPKKYTRPQPPPSSSSSDDDDTGMDHEPVIMSRRVLRDLCRGKTAASLPPELRQFATLEVIPMADPHVQTLPHATQDPADQIQKTQSTEIPATQELSLFGDPLLLPPKDLRVTGLQDPSPTRSATPTHRSTTARPKASEQSREQAVQRTKDQDKGKAKMHEMNMEPLQIQPPQERPRSNTTLALGWTATPPYEDSSGSRSGQQNFREGRVSAARFSATVLPRGQSGGHVPNTPKEKPIQILSRGSEHNWADKGPNSLDKGPNSLDQTLRALQTEARRKRKSSNGEPSEPTKKQGNQVASVAFNAAGFYEAQVDNNHISALAEGCGLTTEQIQLEIEADNAQRRDQISQQQPFTDSNAEDIRMMDIEYDLSRFDPDPNDELTSDED